jgi:predicted glycosyltransferase
VLHGYGRGWDDGTVYDDPVPGACEGLAHLAEDGYEVVIFTTRERSQVTEALARWGWPAYPVTNHKMAAVFQIDDRAIRFVSWPQALAEVHQRYPLRTEG